MTAAKLIKAVQKNAHDLINYTCASHTLTKCH